MAVSKITLGGIPLRVNPHEVRWNFKMKADDTKSLGGKVIQVMGVTLSDITMKGQFAPDRTKGDTEAWQQQMRFRSYIESLSEAAETARGGRAKPLKFRYPPRNWDFNVFVKSLTPYHMSEDTISEQWEVVLFPVDGGSREVIDGIKDLYIKRLMDGVGWKRTDYNGPTQAEIDQRLDGLSPAEYMRKRYQEEFEEGAG